MQKKRNVFIDSAKGVGIILVMMSHSCGFPIFGGLINAYYMAMFFFLSGYVFRKGDSMKADIIKREKRILKPYFAYSFIVMLIWGITIINSELFTVKTFIRNIVSMLYSRAWIFRGEVEKNFNFSVGGKFPQWFFTCMAAATVIFVLIVYILPRFKSTRVAAIILMASLISITGLLSYLPILLPWSIDMAFLTSFFMLLGYFMGKNNFFEKLNGKTYALILVTSLIMYIILYYLQPDTNYSVGQIGNYGILSALIFAGQGVFGSVVVVLLCKLIENNFVGKLLAFIGRHTIIILCLHLYCFDFLNMLLNALGVPATVYGKIRITDIVIIALTTASLIAIDVLASKVLLKIKKRSQSNI